MPARTATSETKRVDRTLLEHAFAKAISTGDIVNFRFLFLPFSPGRVESPERFEAPKFAYLQPDPHLASSPPFNEALHAVRRPDTWTHVEKELSEKRPAQLPSELVLLLADRAVRLGKFTTAAQAYEVLRIRRRMQTEFFDQADRALDEGNVSSAVNGYLIGRGLAYDYAAFPEPLPRVPDYQTAALKLHGEYPKRPEDAIALQPIEAHVNVALEYLLNDPEPTSRLRGRRIEQRLAFTKELVRRLDPDWPEFASRYRGACKLAKSFGERLQRRASGNGAEESLQDEIEEQTSDDPMQITAHLLGREIAQGVWWQYLKEIAYEHPAAALFVARQIVGDREILLPRYRSGSSLALSVGLNPESGDGDGSTPV